MTVFLIITSYILIGSAIGGLYFYLRYKHYRDYDLEEMDYLPIFLSAFWPILAPFIFAIYIAKRIAEREDEEK